MLYRRTSPEESKRFSYQLEIKRLQQKRRHRLYNRAYRKGCFFISACFVRTVYIVLFFSVFYLHNSHGSYAKEIVLDREIKRYSYVYSGSVRSGADLFIQTNYDKYNSNVSGKRFKDFNIGDTLIIERNIFARPIYFSKISWSVAYPFSVNLKFYFAVLFITSISLAFNNGLDRPFTNNLLKITMAINIFAIACYFLG